eukprot:scaffold121_cov356-Pavlova_lutheri.AAC.8
MGNETNPFENQETRCSQPPSKESSDSTQTRSPSHERLNGLLVEMTMGFLPFQRSPRRGGSGPTPWLAKAGPTGWEWSNAFVHFGNDQHSTRVDTMRLTTSTWSGRREKLLEGRPFNHRNANESLLRHARTLWVRASSELARLNAVLDLTAQERPASRYGWGNARSHKRSRAALRPYMLKEGSALRRCP